MQKNKIALNIALSLACLVWAGAAPAQEAKKDAPPAAPADLPDWAYPRLPPPVVWDAVVQKQMPGSTRHYTQAQIEDDFAPPDWYPEEHPPMPEVVSHGRPPAVKACMKCHLASGDGHPESSSIAGLPLGYFVRQLTAFKTGARGNPRAVSMIPIAKAVTDEEALAAANYFATLKPTVWFTVVESATVPKTFVGQGAMRFAAPGNETEPIGNRIIELPRDPARAESRDPHSGFIAHVPPGSVEKGKVLVITGGGGRTLACATCHGANLKGDKEVPSIVGRAPQYVFRQLNDIKAGRRKGAEVEAMQPVVANISAEDMIAIAAYLASREQ